MRPIERLVIPAREQSGVSRTVLVIATLLSSGAALIGASTAAAGPAVSETTTMTYAGTNMCAGGEAFTGTANVHTEVNENLSATGALQSHFNYRIDGMKAVTVLGKKYVVQDTLNHEFVFSGADEDTYDTRVHYIRLGEDGTFVWGDDFYEYFHSHITSNHLGVITAFEIQMSDSPCQ